MEYSGMQLLAIGIIEKAKEDYIRLVEETRKYRNKDIESFSSNKNGEAQRRKLDELDELEKFFNGESWTNNNYRKWCTSFEMEQFDNKSYPVKEKNRFRSNIHGNEEIETRKSTIDMLLQIIGTDLIGKDILDIIKKEI